MLPIHCLDGQQFCCQELLQSADESSSAPRGVVGHRTQCVFSQTKGQKTRRQQHSSQVCAVCLHVLAKPQLGKRRQVWSWKQLKKATSKGCGHHDHQGVSEEPLTDRAGIQGRELSIPS